MLEYNVAQSDEDLIITILEGDYKYSVAKIVGLQFDKDGQPSFELELPSTKTHLFTDEKFISTIQDIVGDILKKSVDFLWNSQNELMKINDKMCEILMSNKIPLTEEYTELERCLSKGFILKLDESEETVLAIEMKENKEYNLSNEEDFKYVKTKVYSNIELN